MEFGGGGQRYLCGCRGILHKEAHCHMCSDLKQHRPPPLGRETCTARPQTEKAAAAWQNDTAGEKKTNTQLVTHRKGWPRWL